MGDFDKSDKMIKIVEKWIDQTLAIGSVVILRSLFKEKFEEVLSWINNKISLIKPL